MFLIKFLITSGEISEWWPACLQCHCFYHSLGLLLKHQWYTEDPFGVTHNNYTCSESKENIPFPVPVNLWPVSQYRAWNDTWPSSGSHLWFIMLHTISLILLRGISKAMSIKNMVTLSVVHEERCCSMKHRVSEESLSHACLPLLLPLQPPLGIFPCYLCL